MSKAKQCGQVEICLFLCKLFANNVDFHKITCAKLNHISDNSIKKNGTRRQGEITMTQYIVTNLSNGNWTPYDKKKDAMARYDCIPQAKVTKVNNRKQRVVIAIK